MSDPIDITDGRRQRSEDSKQKIVAAMLELVREGKIAPTAEKPLDGDTTLISRKKLLLLFTPAGGTGSEKKDQSDERRADREERRACELRDNARMREERRQQRFWGLSAIDLSWFELCSQTDGISLVYTPYRQ